MRILELAAVISVVCACDDRVRVDICPRGNLAALAASLAGGELELILRDQAGGELDRQLLDGTGKTFTSDAWDRATQVDVVGRDVDGKMRAFGTAAVGGDGACVCLSRVEDAATACADVVCVAAGDTCSFRDESGAALSTCTVDAATQGSYAALVLASEPLVYYRLEEPSGSIAGDAAGGLDGTYLGSTVLARAGALVGETSLAMEVMALDSGLLMPESVHPWPGDFTAELWFQPLQVPAYKNVLLVREEYQVRGFRFGFRTDRLLQLWCDESGCALDGIAGRTPLELGAWHHIALWHQGTDVRLYLDGAEDAAGALAYAGPLPSDTGGWGSSQGTPSQGRFDELVIYSRALSPGEIASHYEAGASGMRLVCR